MAEGTQTTDITQGSVFSKLLRHGSLYFISSAISKFMALLMLPVTTRLFSETEYGAIATITSASALVVIFLGLYLDAAYARYYYEYKDDRARLRRYTSTIYWFTVAWGGLVVVISSVWAGRFTNVAGAPVWPVLALAFFAGLPNQLSTIGSVYLQQNHRAGLVTVLNLANLFVNIPLLLLLVGVFHMSLTGRFISTLVGIAVSAAISTWVLYHEGLLRFRFSWPMLKESLAYAIPLLPNIGAGWVAGVSDRILLSLYGTLADTGIYSVGYSLGSALAVFSQAVFLVYGPMMFAMLKKDTQLARLRIEHFVPYYFMGMLWAFLALALFANDIVHLMAARNYASAAAVVPVVLFAYFLGSQYSPFVSVLSYERRTWVISAGAILQAVVNFGANLVFIPHFGKMAAAWTTVAAVGAYTIWMYAWSQKAFSLRLDWKRILTSGIIMGLAGWGAGQILVAPALAASTLAAMGVKAALLLIVPALLWATGCILPVDKRRVWARLARF